MNDQNNHENPGTSSNDSLSQKLQDLLSPFLEEFGTKEKIKEWSTEANAFICRNPWVACAGALAIGYLIGTRHRSCRGEE